MSNIKLVLADIDGTLVPILSVNPSKRVKEIVKKVQEKGVEIAPVTGRPYEMVQELFQHIDFHDYGIFDGGATIREIKTGKIVWSNWLSQARLKQIATILLPVSSKIDFFPVHNDADAHTVSTDDIVSDAPYVYALVDETKGQEAINQIKQLKDLSIHVHYAHDEWKGYLNVQITDSAADKYHAIVALRTIVHSAQEETLAIGDSANDIPLMKAAGLKIAMGNAINELKEMSDFVVADVEHDGFAEAMERFVLTD